MFTSLLQDMIKDTDEEPDEGCMGCEVWGALSAGASVLMELGAPPSWNVDVRTNLESLTRNHTIGVSRRLPNRV